MITDKPKDDDAAQPRLGGGLIGRNVRIRSRRTSVRLEPEMWDALYDVAGLENCSIHDLCGAVEDMRDPSASFTAALRVFIMEYYRNAARANRPVSQIQRRVAEEAAARRSGKSV